MATVAKVAKASLQRILVQASEADLEPDEYNDWIFALNNWMLAHDADGIRLGFTEVSSLGDEITVPTGALRGIIAGVAIEVAPDYSGAVTPALVKAADEGLQTMRRLGAHIAQTQFPCTLPRGSGNTGYAYGSSRFYPALEATILAETTGSIALETYTEDGGGVTPVIPGDTFTWLNEDGTGFVSALGWFNENDQFFAIPPSWLDENGVAFGL